MSAGAEVFVHKHGICETRQVGSGTRVWAFAHILPGAKVGKDCNICDHVFIENDVVIGDAVTIKNGVQIWDGVRLADRVFVGPNATFTNDSFPRSKQFLEQFPLTVVEEGASIGANATILPGIKVGRSAMVGAAAVVTKDVPANAVVVGNPAVIVGYQTNIEARASGARTGVDELPRTPRAKRSLDVGGCELWRLPQFSDLRGELTALDFDTDLPFDPARTFLVFGVPTDRVRGEHAHHRCEQFLIAAHGAASVAVDDGRQRAEVSLDDPSVGLYIPPMTWRTMYRCQPDTTLIVMASMPYDPDDYIRNYESFLKQVAGA